MHSDRLCLVVFQACIAVVPTQHLQHSHRTHISILIQQVIQVIIVPAALPPVHSDLLRLLLLFAHSLQNRLELRLVDFLAQLATTSKHDQAALDILCARGLHKADSANAVGGFGLEDLGEDRGADFGFAFSV